MANERDTARELLADRVAPAIAEDRLPIVLLVEPDDAVRDSFALLLEIQGLGVSAHAAIEDTVDLVRLCRPDCVIVDLHRTATDWPAFHRRFGSLFAGIPTIMISGRWGPEKRAIADLMGCRYRLTSPVEGDQFFEIVAEAMTAAAGRPAGACPGIRPPTIRIA